MELGIKNGKNFTILSIEEKDIEQIFEKLKSLSFTKEIVKYKGKIIPLQEINEEEFKNIILPLQTKEEEIQKYCLKNKPLENIILKYIDYYENEFNEIVSIEDLNKSLKENKLYLGYVEIQDLSDLIENYNLLTRQEIEFLEDLPELCGVEVYLNPTTNKINDYIDVDEIFSYGEFHYPIESTISPLLPKILENVEMPNELKQKLYCNLEIKKTDVSL